MKTKTAIPDQLAALLQLLTFATYAKLRMDNAGFIKEPRSFGDTREYMEIAAQSLFSMEFWTGYKAPIAPLFWKLAGVAPERIFDLQLAFSVFCWTALAVAAARLSKSPIVRVLTFLIVLAFSLSEHIIMWDPFLGSESTAISLTALFLACALWLSAGWRTGKALALVAVIFLLAFTKEASAYQLVMTTTIAALVFWFTKYRKPALAIGAMTLLIFAGSALLANKGERQSRVLFTTTAFRILPSEEYTAYFRSRGMPIQDELVARSKNIQPGKRYEVVGSLFNDPEFSRWVSKSGQAEYLRFLWFFKKDTLQNVFLETPDESFAPDVYYLTATGYRPIIKDERLKELLYPLKFSLLYFFAVNLAAAAVCLYALQNQKAHWLIPLSIILLTYPQAILVWSADALDIARHSIVFNVFFRLGPWLLLLFALDDFIAWARFKIWR